MPTAREGEKMTDKREQHHYIFREDGSYLFDSEREMLKLAEEQDRAGEIKEPQARYLIAHFLFGRILIKQLILEPWKHGVGSRSPPSPVTQGNLRVIAFMLYSALVAGFPKSEGPTQELSIFTHIGSLPGDEGFLLANTKDLQALLKVCLACLALCPKASSLNPKPQTLTRSVSRTHLQPVATTPRPKP